jgi:hypothetical protein
MPEFNINLVAWLVALVIVLLGALANRSIEKDWFTFNMPIVLITLFLSVYTLLALKIAKEWERVVVLRLGKFNRLKGPGMFFIIPLVDSIAQVVDMRIRATDFASESTLTKDTVPVNVDAICFWMVWDAKKAILEVEDYYPKFVRWKNFQGIFKGESRVVLSELRFLLAGNCSTDLPP